MHNISRSSSPRINQLAILLEQLVLISYQQSQREWYEHFHLQNSRTQLKQVFGVNAEMFLGCKLKKIYVKEDNTQAACVTHQVLWNSIL